MKWAPALLLGAAALAGATQADPRPITKVVKMMEGIMKSLKSDAEAEDEMFQKFDCWCQKVKKTATDNIATNQKREGELKDLIEDRTALSASLTAQLANLRRDLEEDIKALADATAIREKELAKFNENEKDQLVTIQALEQAIRVLKEFYSDKKDKDGALLQFRKLMQKVPIDSTELLSPDERQTVSSFMQQQKKDFFGAKNIFHNSYAPASKRIFGILNNMLETFRNNMGESQKNELAAAKAFAELKAEKEQEIADGKKSIEEKDAALTKSNAELEQAKQDLPDTREAIEADRKFMDESMLRCQKFNQDKEARHKQRAEEIDAVAKAIAILDDEDAHATFAKTTFLQLSASSAVHRASRSLRKAAIRLGSSKLGQAATFVDDEATARALQPVIKYLDELIADVKEEMADDQSTRDNCIATFAELDRTKDQLTVDMKRSNTQINEYQENIAQLEKDLEALANEIKQLQEDLAQATEVREKEAKEFNQSQSDNQQSIVIIGKAIQVLANYYEKNHEASLLSTQIDPKDVTKQAKSAQEVVGEAPPEFARFEKKGGSSVLDMLRKIAHDIEQESTEAVNEEKYAQQTFDELKTETHDTIEAKKAAIIDAEDQKEAAEKSLEQTQQELEGQQADMVAAQRKELATHNQCDFLMKNFEVRRQKFISEIDAIGQAKEILSGSSEK
jgi:chromosome segregation ATPase